MSPFLFLKKRGKCGKNVRTEVYTSESPERKYLQLDMSIGRVNPAKAFSMQVRGGKISITAKSLTQLYEWLMTLMVRALEEAK